CLVQAKEICSPKRRGLLTAIRGSGILSVAKQERGLPGRGRYGGLFLLRFLLSFCTRHAHTLIGTNRTQYTLNVPRLPKRSPCSSETRDRVPAAEQTKIDRIPGPLSHQKPKRLSSWLAGKSPS